MSRFNSTSVGTRTTNLAGGRAYKEDAKLEIASILLTSFVQDQFYRSADDTMARLKDLIEALPDKRFAAQAAIYARTQHNMRSISHVAAGEIARLVKGEQWTKRFFAAVVQRPDDATEILSYYKSNYGKPIPNSLKKGLAAGLAKFDSYQFGKYRGEGKDLSLVDLVNITHPTPSPRNAEALKQLIEGTLKNTDTWEAKLTEAGKSADSEEEKEELKSAAWGELIANRKLGYMALLRNLRNIIEQSPESLDGALAMLVDPRLVEKSRVLPFRLVTAIEEIEKIPAKATETRKTVVALSQAIDLALKNLPEFPGNTLISVDVSGSMNGRPIRIASLFAAALYKASNATLQLFATDARFVTLNPTDSTLSLARAIEQRANGGGTNFHTIFDSLTSAHIYDRIIVLSDMQGWMENNPWGARATMPQSLAKYESRTGAKPHLFSFDLQGYGTLQLPQDRVYCLAGFSEKTLELMDKLEQDPRALVREIQGVEL